MTLEDIYGLIGCLANIATFIAVAIAADACYLQLKQIKLDSYIRCSEWSASFADTLRLEVFPRSRILDYISSTCPQYRKVKRSLTVASLDSFEENELINLSGVSCDELSASISSYIESPNNWTELLKEYKEWHLCYPDLYPCHDGFDSGDMKAILNKNVTEIANCLEGLALQVNSGLVNEDVLYPSVHGSFLAAVRLIYPFLCAVEEASSLSAPSFPHLATLLALWNKQDESDSRHLREEKDKLSKGYRLRRKMSMHI